MTKTVGFIGLGLMGEGFTRRLIETGRHVIGYDVDAAKVEAATRWGVAPAASPGEAARAADVVLVCVVNTAAVEAVAADIAEAGRLDGKTLVDHSTTEIAATLRLAETLRERTGMAFVDAPVSGGPDAARTGALSIMAGGSEAALEAVAPVLGLLGNVAHMGGVGAGQATKLVNQTIVLTNYCVLAEALRLAEAHGVDAARIPDALKMGHAGSNLLPIAFERMVAKDFAPRGYVRQVLKDLEMLQADARDHHVAMPMASQALTLFRLLYASGGAERDASAIVTLYPEPR